MSIMFARETDQLNVDQICIVPIRVAQNLVIQIYYFQQLNQNGILLENLLKS